MAKILLSKDDYYSQRNNKINPLVACMPTSYVMYLKANKIPYSNDSKVRFGIELSDDDYFMKLLNTDEAKKFCYKKYPWAFSTDPAKLYPPNEVHGIYSSYLEPIVCGKRYSDFYTDLSYTKVRKCINSDIAIMTSGKFLDSHIDGHAFVMIGEDDIEILIADPYGNFHTNHKDPKGYCITMNEVEFNSILKYTGTNNLLKYGHLPIDRYKALGVI